MAFRIFDKIEPILIVGSRDAWTLDSLFLASAEMSKLLGI